MGYSREMTAYLNEHTVEGDRSLHLRQPHEVLSEGQAEVVELRSQGYSVNEIAEILGLSYHAVWHRLSRAKGNMGPTLSLRTLGS